MMAALQELVNLMEARNALFDNTVKPEERNELLMQVLRPKEQRNWPNPFNMPDEHFVFYFHFEKGFVEELLIELSSRCYLLPTTQDPMPFDLCVLATLNFMVFGHVDYIEKNVVYFPFTKSMLISCVPKACDLIVNFMTPFYIRLYRKPEELNACKSAFLHQFGVPGVIGVMDCCFVRLSKIPIKSTKLYTDRHGNLSVNVQMICDHTLRFLDLNARYSGNTRDIYIWQHSNVKSMIEQLSAENHITWLVADRGYMLQSVVMNPYRNPLTPQHIAYNKRMNDVQRILDIAVCSLKTRFHCLNTVLPFNHTQCSNIITACGTLHNFMIDKGYDIFKNIEIKVSAPRQLKNSLHEDSSKEGTYNRELIAHFIQ